jgi:hypothetical protein
MIAILICIIIHDLYKRGIYVDPKVIKLITSKSLYANKYLKFFKLYLTFEDLITIFPNAQLLETAASDEFFLTSLFG